jgi:hypothetical protein
LALRVVASAFGIATVLVSYLLVRRLFSSRVGLLTVAWLSVSLWHVIFSRIGLRTVSLPFFVVLLLYCLWRGFEALALARSGTTAARAQLGWFTATGLFLGLSMYTYTAARLLPLVVIAFLIYLGVIRPSFLRRSVPYLAIAAIVAGAVVVPEAIYFANNPVELVDRTRNLTSIGDDVASGHVVAAFVQHITRVAGMFNVAGDVNWDRNIPGRPILDPISSALMGVGLIIALRRWKKHQYALLLIWLTVLIVPGFFVARDEPNFIHYTGLIPAIFVLPALAADQLWGVWERLTPARLAFLPFLAAGCAYLIAARNVYVDYFGTWAHSPDVAYLFDSDRWLTLDLARREASTHPGLFAVAAGEPDARLPRFALEGQPVEPAIRVFNGKRSLPMPPPGTPVTYLFSARDQPPPDLRDARHGFSPAIVLASTPSGDPVIAQTLDAARPPVKPDHPEIVRFGDSLEVTGFDVPSDVAAGHVLTVRWYWQILRTDSRNIALFNQLLDETETKRGQLDDRPYAPRYWSTGTTGVSWFDVPVDPNAPTGPVSLVVGAYDPSTMERLPVFDAQGRPAGDHVTLGPIKVHGQPALAPDIAVDQLVHFSDQIDLIGYSESSVDLADGHQATLTVVWRARGRPSRDYTVFVHLLDDRNQLVAQADSPPRHGRYPTSIWDEGELVSDAHQLTLPTTLPPGTYHYSIGWYLPETGARLAAVDDAGRHLGDTVNLDGPTITTAGG